MPLNSYKFISPSVQIKEFDRSQLKKPLRNIRSCCHPEGQNVVLGMTPVTIDSYLEFVEKFGTPSKGLPGSDVWRGGDITSPTYGSYAAQAYLKNSTPLTFIRLLGIAHPDPLSTGFQQAGWGTTNLAAATALGTNGGAYGLFIIPSASAYASSITRCSCRYLVLTRSAE